MGLLNRIFGHRKEPSKPQQSKPPDKQSGERESKESAAALKAAGDLPGAIQLLRAEVDEMKGQTSFAWTPNCYLQLAAYLQESGANDDGWSMLQKVAGEAVRTQKGANLHFCLSQIYDKQRLYVQREGRHLAAIGPGVIAYFEEAIACWRRCEEDPALAEHFQSRLQQHTGQDNTQQYVRALLKKTGRPDLETSVVELLLREIERLPNPDSSAVITAIQKLL